MQHVSAVKKGKLMNRVNYFSVYNMAFNLLCFKEKKLQY